MNLTKNINTGDEELVFRTISTSPKEHFEGRWKSGRLYPLYSVVVNNGTTFVSQNAKMKEEPYVIYDAVKQEFKANDGWKIKEMSADSRLTALGGGSAGGGVTPEDVAEMISGKQDTIEDLSTIRSGASAGATAYQKPNSGIPASDIASGVIPTDVVKYSLQTLTDAQKAEARANIEAQDFLVSGTNIKTVNGESILGSGNIVAGDPNAVKYTEQTLTDAQKTQARTNVGAGTYSKPSGGIPASDLASGVVPDVSGFYTKPAGGIPASDLADGVIPSVPTISTDVSADAASDVKTSSPKSVKTYVDAGIAAVESDLSDLADEVESIDIGAYEVAWDGNSTPVVANIPAGVTVTYNTTTYTGELAASASTIQKIYLVATGTTDNYDRYITVGDSTYSWVNIGTTEITLADYATKSEVDQLEAEVHNLSGKYYGIFEDAESLPEGDAVGYAFVGTQAPFAIYQFDGTDWADSEAEAQAIYGEPGADGVGLQTITSLQDGTVVLSLTNGDTVTLDLNHNHPQYYSKEAEASQPQGGFLPDVIYKLGTLTGSVTFALAAAVTGNANHYFIVFDTGGTAPTITWPSGLTWAAGSAPTLAANKHYEISIMDGVAAYLEV